MARGVALVGRRAIPNALRAIAIRRQLRKTPIPILWVEGDQRLPRMVEANDDARRGAIATRVEVLQLLLNFAVVEFAQG